MGGSEAIGAVADFVELNILAAEIVQCYVCLFFGLSFPERATVFIAVVNAEKLHEDQAHYNAAVNYRVGKFLE